MNADIMNYETLGQCAVRIQIYIRHQWLVIYKNYATFYKRIEFQFYIELSEELLQLEVGFAFNVQCMWKFLCVPLEDYRIESRFSCKFEKFVPFLSIAHYEFHENACQWAESNKLWSLMLNPFAQI